MPVSLYAPSETSPLEEIYKEVLVSGYNSTPLRGPNLLKIKSRVTLLSNLIEKAATIDLEEV